MLQTYKTKTTRTMTLVMKPLQIQGFSVTYVTFRRNFQQNLRKIKIRIFTDCIYLILKKFEFFICINHARIFFRNKMIS